MPDKTQSDSTQQQAGAEQPAPSALPLGDRTRSDGSWEREDIFKPGNGTDPGFDSQGVDPRSNTEKQKLIRLMADFDNFKKRAQKERDNTILYANERLMRDLLPLLDDLERAVSHFKAGDSESAQSFFSGVTHIMDGFKAVLDKAGAKPFASVGQAFNPLFHEAVVQIKDPNSPEGVVLDEVLRGYLLNGRLLRPSRVVVNGGKVNGTGNGVKPAEAFEPISRPAPVSAPTSAPAPEVTAAPAPTPPPVVEVAVESPPAPPVSAEEIAKPAPESTAHAFVLNEDDFGALDDWHTLFTKGTGKRG